MRKIPTWCHFANLSPLVSSEPHVLQDTWFNIWTSSTSWVMFEMPLLPLQQYVEQVNRIGTPSHVRNLRPLYPPYSTIHSTDGLSWHVDLFVLNFPGLFLRNAMFNVWIKMASWIILEISVPCPTEQYVEDMDTYLESFLKFTAPWPYKAIHLTYGESWHVEYLLECSLPCTYKAKGWTIEAS